MFLLGHISLLPLVLVLSCWDIITRCQSQDYHGNPNSNHIHNTNNDKQANLLMDLMFSDSNHAHETHADTQDTHADEQQNVLYIDHGGGAVSHIRRTSFYPKSLPNIPLPLPLQSPLPSPLPSPPSHISHVTNNIPLTHRVDQLPLQHQPITPFAPPPHVNHYPNPIFEGGFGDGPAYFNYPNPNQDIPRLFQRRVGAENKPKVITRAAPVEPKRIPPLIEPKVEEKPIIPIISKPHPLPPQFPAPQNPPFQNSPFNFNFNQPELFPFIDGPFSPLAPPPLSPLFQRRRLTVNNNVNNLNNNEFHPNAINAGGYPSYTYYKGGDQDQHGVTNWPKIFKFTDGRANLSEFEKQKKHGKIKFSSKDDYFDNISRDSFLILHGGTFSN